MSPEDRGKVEIRPVAHSSSKDSFVVMVPSEGLWASMLVRLLE